MHAANAPSILSSLVYEASTHWPTLDLADHVIPVSHLQVQQFSVCPHSFPENCIEQLRESLYVYVCVRQGILYKAHETLSYCSAASTQVCDSSISYQYMHLHLCPSHVLLFIPVSSLQIVTDQINK